MFNLQDPQTQADIGIIIWGIVAFVLTYKSNPIRSIAIAIATVILALIVINTSHVVFLIYSYLAYMIITSYILYITTDNITLRRRLKIILLMLTFAFLFFIYAVMFHS